MRITNWTSEQAVGLTVILIGNGNKLTCLVSEKDIYISGIFFDLQQIFFAVATINTTFAIPIIKGGI
jgi:hypothetical protein